MTQPASKDEEKREKDKIQEWNEKYTNIVDSWQLELAITTRQSDKSKWKERYTAIHKWSFYHFCFIF